MKLEFPKCPDDFIALVLDVYDKEPSMIHKIYKDARKQAKGELKISAQQTASQIEALDVKFKTELKENVIVEEHPEVVECPAHAPELE